MIRGCPEAGRYPALSGRLTQFTGVFQATPDKLEFPEAPFSANSSFEFLAMLTFSWMLRNTLVMGITNAEDTRFLAYPLGLLKKSGGVVVHFITIRAATRLRSDVDPAVT